MKINATEIRVGMILEYKDDLWEVLKTNHVKPGKGGAFAQVEMKSLTKNTKLNERFRSSETVEKASLEEIKYNFLYSDENNFYFMNPVSFEQINLSKNIVGDKAKMLTENLEVTINFHNEEPLSILLPNQLTSVIDTTDAALKGQTVSSSYKPAILKSAGELAPRPYLPTAHPACRRTTHDSHFSLGSYYDRILLNNQHLNELWGVDPRSRRLVTVWQF